MYRPTVLLPYEDVLGTLIHELTHNLVSNHSSEFYKTMEELYDEVEKSDTATSTFNIQGSALYKPTTVPFQGRGHTLGTGSSFRSEFSSLAAEAACKRRALATGIHNP